MKILYSLLILLIPFLATTIGSASVIFFKKDKMNPNIEKICEGLAAGVMLAAAIFGLLMPALEYEVSYMPNILLVILAFILGVILLLVIDHLVPHFHIEGNYDEGPQSHISKMNKMFLAVLMHNIPEGLSVGIALGLALNQINTDNITIAAFASTLSLSIGIAIQNIPEGAVVSLPIKASTGSRKKGFLFGFLSGAVEPIFGVIGLLLAFYIESLMPWALALAAGAMFYVTIEDLIPNAVENSKHHLGIISFIVGFLLMMALDYLL